MILLIMPTASPIRLAICIPDLLRAVDLLRLRDRTTGNLGRLDDLPASSRT